MAKATLLSGSPQTTQRLARSLARFLRPGDCLALTGEFGCGKTTFVKGLVEGLSGRKKKFVASPSFVILKIYPGKIPVYHFDVYRLRTPDDAAACGLEDHLNGDGVCVVEWADRIQEVLPGHCYRLHFTITGERERLITMEARDERFLDAWNRGAGKRSKTEARGIV